MYKYKVRESFNEYKKTIEHNLVNISYLYSGDVISHTDYQYKEIKSSPLTSPSFIISTFVEIYNKSFDIMKSKSKTLIIPEESIKGIGINGNIFDKIFELGIKPVYIFCSKKAMKLFGQVREPNSTSALPSYFHSIDNFTGMNLELYYSPLIEVEEDSDEIVLYVSDAPIQGLVYSIQNMDYFVDPTSTIEGFIPNIPDRWEHKINYNLYDCKFNSYKISVRNLSRLRDDKINKILNDN